MIHPTLVINEHPAAGISRLCALAVLLGLHISSVNAAQRLSIAEQAGKCLRGGGGSGGQSMSSVVLCTGYYTCRKGLPWFTSTFSIMTSSRFLLAY